MAFFPNEIDVSRITKGFSKQQNTVESGDFSVPLLYEGKPIHIQLDDVRVVFGILDYFTPQQRYLRHSLGLDMDDLSMDPYREFFSGLETWVKENAGVPKDSQFFSFIRTNAKSQAHMRVKVPGTRNERLCINMYVNGRDHPMPDVRFARNYVEHGTKVGVILRLNSLWSTGNKFGVSWALDGLNVYNREFRRN